jgi:hypothetical protein
MFASRTCCSTVAQPLQLLRQTTAAVAFARSCNYVVPYKLRQAALSAKHHTAAAAAADDDDDDSTAP